MSGKRSEKRKLLPLNKRETERAWLITAMPLLFDEVAEISIFNAN